MVARSVIKEKKMNNNLIKRKAKKLKETVNDADVINNYEEQNQYENIKSKLEKELLRLEEFIQKYCSKETFDSAYDSAVEDVFTELLHNDDYYLAFIQARSEYKEGKKEKFCDQFQRFW